jgi:hypothetical protein
VARKLAIDHSKLAGLGMERETTEEQRRYLTDRAQQFQRLVLLAVNARYDRDAILNKQELRLATLVSKRSETFSHNLALYGHMNRFQASDDSEEIDGDPSSDHAPVSSSDQSFEPDDSSIDFGLDTREISKESELNHIFPSNETVFAPDDGAIDTWLQPIYERSRGFELGTLNPSILATTMKLQSLDWTPIALGYISDIATLVHRFVNHVLKYICPEGKANLLAVLAEGLFERYTKAVEQVRFLLHVECAGTPITLNHYFSGNLEKKQVVTFVHPSIAIC